LPSPSLSASMMVLSTICCSCWSCKCQLCSVDVLGREVLRGWKGRTGSKFAAL
jgi:hypothetical protein